MVCGTYNRPVYVVLRFEAFLLSVLVLLAASEYYQDSWHGNTVPVRNIKYPFCVINDYQ